jgi:hypothetical protein
MLWLGAPASDREVIGNVGGTTTRRIVGDVAVQRPARAKTGCGPPRLPLWMPKKTP